MLARLRLMLLTAVAVLVLLAAVGLAMGWPGGSASADDPPPADMHQACLNLDAQAMDQMHQAMMGEGTQMTQETHCQH